jgi:predicted house-cleaning NTP pyrophosphatase (Maf/HAM1 superfamily)
VKHVTVNADQAVVTDSVVTGKHNDAASSAKLLAAATEKSMEIIEPMQEETVPVGGRGAKEE